MESINNKTITIIREHDKLCILERLLKSDPKLEKIVGNFIDTYCPNTNTNTNNCQNTKLELFNMLKDNNVTDIILLTRIIKLTFSIIHDTPFEITISNNNNIKDLVKYLNQPYIPFLPNDYFPAFS
jgi:hypothetical protein